MGRSALIARNKKRQRLVLLYCERVNRLRKVIRSKESSAGDKLMAYKMLSAIPRDALKCRIRNLCSITGRSSGFYRDLGVSRIVLRKEASFGNIPGLFKGSL